MTRFAYTVHRVLAATLFVVILVSMGDYFLGLGFFGRNAALVIASVIVVGVIYLGFLAPTREEIRKQREANKLRRGD